MDKTIRATAAKTIKITGVLEGFEEEVAGVKDEKLCDANTLAFLITKEYNSGVTSALSAQIFINAPGLQKDSMKGAIR